jgi:hypothetical protein
MSGPRVSVRVVPIRTVIEHGPKDKRVVAFAPDWPGWSRGAKTAEDALAALDAYRLRYRPIAATVRLASEFDAQGAIRVVEEKVGTGSTDFWGISFSPCRLETEPMDDAELKRKIKLLRSCWSYFDTVATRVSPTMAKGPRGGGRERDQIIGHTIRVESEDFAKKVGVRVPPGMEMTASELADYRDAYVAAMIGYNKGAVKPMGSWNLPFLIRHSAFHTMDHAWEMEDKDLSGRSDAAR